jgi:hypothetical protein
LISRQYHSARADELAHALDAPSAHQVEPLATDETTVVFPVEAVSEAAGALHQVVLVLADIAESLGNLETALDLARSSFEFVVRKTLDACAAVSLDASVLHLLAPVVLSEEEAALASITAIVVVGLTVGDHAMVVYQLERLEAFLASVVGLLQLASQQHVVPALLEDERVFGVAPKALALSIVLLTKLDSLHAFALA